MGFAKLQIPKSKNSELYYDANELKVSFRPKKSEGDGKTLSATSLRVVVQVFGNVVEDKYFSRSTTIRFGSGRRNKIKVGLIGVSDRFSLITYKSNGEIQLLIPKHMTGVIQTPEKLESISNMDGSDKGESRLITLPPGSRGAIENQHITIYFEEIADPEKLPPIPILKQLSDPYLMRWVAVSVALHLSLLLLLKFLPPGFFSFGKPPAIEKSEQGIQVKLDPKKFPPFIPKSKMGQMISRGQQGREGEGARAAGTEGRRGAGKQGRTGGGKLSKKDIGRSGVLDFFNKSGSKNIFGDLLGTGSGISGAAQNLGSAPAEHGIKGGGKRYGKGLQGQGTGGGGTTASIGEGLGTKGRGAGAKGSGLADFGAGRSNIRVSAQIPDDEVVIAGTLSKEEVARIINNKIGQIKYCYEKELVKNPKLKGKIVVNFIIGLQGSVTRSSISQSSMG
ncbi:MAG: AgmX/PglI C-terminal domain-containing protein, partial [Bdellovibrionales bacterium]|nr:AgmX/PglI C-terminal domain-containing protein [Bdellovibrionales bacterium]